MSAWKYKSVMPRVIVAKLKLIEPKDMVNLADRSLDIICSTLMTTPYGAEISAIPAGQLDSTSLKKAFLENFIKTCDEIIAHSPKEIGYLVSTVLMKFEADNIKAMFRTKKAGMSVDEALEYITPLRNLNEAKCRTILENSKNIEDVVKLLSDLEYGPVLQEALKDYQKTGELVPLEVALDKYVYCKLWETTEKLHGLDKRISRAVLETEIDVINIKVILRCKVMGIDENQMKRYLIPISDVFNEKVLERAVKAVDVKSSIESLLASAKAAMARSYRTILTQILSEYETSRLLSSVEPILDKAVLKTSVGMLKKYTPFFNIGLILAFLNLKWFEVRNLGVIVRGAEEKSPPSQIKKLLILPS